MTVRRVLERVFGGIVTVCVTAYFAAVAVNAQVSGSANWWPYPWLWALAAVAAVSAIAWLIVALWRSRPKDRAHASSKTEPEQPKPLAQTKLTPAQEPQGKVITDFTVINQYWSAHAYGELRTDGRWWLFESEYDTSRPMGWIVPDDHDATFETRDWQNRHVGWFKAVEDGIRGLREYYARLR